eukprot:7858535-Alexandrium_andersonii.AAC.1
MRVCACWLPVLPPFAGSLGVSASSLAAAMRWALALRCCGLSRRGLVARRLARRAPDRAVCRLHPARPAGQADP